jgi:zinc/manganese transport system permease protein
LLYDAIVAPFVEFEFMRRGLVGALALSLGAGPLGVFLMLRRMSLVGDAMAHAILPGAAVAYLLTGLSLGWMTVGGLGAGLAVALLAGAVARTTALTEDASLAAFYLLSLALGVTLVSVRGSSIDLLHVLFGSVLALDDATLLLLASISSVTLAALALLYRPLVLESVDPGFLRSVSRMGGPTHLAFLALVVLNLVAGFHALGTLLAVGIMMLPAISARFWTRDVTGLIALATALGIASSVIGLLVSYHVGLPSGPTMILTAGGFYVASLLFGTQRGWLLRLVPRRHLEA